MPTPLQRLRAGLVAHANALPPGEAKRWLDHHRLAVLGSQRSLRPELRHHLHRGKFDTAAQNLLGIELFKRVVDALQPVPVAALKGIALLDALYPHDVGIRRMCDIDVLIPNSEMEACVARLKRAGLCEGPASRRLRHVMHHRVLRDSMGVVEVHSRLGYSYGRGSAWDELPLLEAVVHGRTCRVLSPAGQLVYLLTHCYKHLPFTELIWVHEILALSEKLPAALPEVAALAHQLRCRNVLAVVTAVFRQALGPDVLPQIDIDALDASPVRRRLHDALFMPRQQGPLHPLPQRSKWLEELRPGLLTDTVVDAVADWTRMARIHYHARFPTRIRPGDH